MRGRQVEERHRTEAVDVNEVCCESALQAHHLRPEISDVIDCGSECVLKRQPANRDALKFTFGGKVRVVPGRNDKKLVTAFSQAGK